MKLALCQLRVTENKADNVSRARSMLFRAADKGAKMAVLPEMFNIAYVASLFRDAAEPCPDGDTSIMLSEAARETGMYIIGGSIPELENGRVYNTSLSYSNTGEFLGKYRKAHLFDIDVPGVYRFMESDAVTPGDNYPLLLPDAPMRTSVMICFDIRFPEWARLAMQDDADLIALPAAFSRATGPRHWELLLRARALDNQLFVAGVAPAQSQTSHGHSMLTTPDGKVLADCGTEERIEVIDIDPALLQDMRSSIPVRTARRTDLYWLTAK